jgi:subtilisin family serine protease
MGFTGQGVVVGGQDTGYEWDHPAIKESYRGWDDTLSQADHNYNWHDAIHEIDSMNGPPYIAEANPCGLSSLVPCDDHNHGTHTMGTMTGTLSDEGKSIGVAPGAKWIACRNMERGYGSPASYIECFEWFLAPTDLNGENPDPSKAPHVIANSWSCPEIEGCTPANFETMQIAVDHLKAAGVVVVVSAGNSGSQCHTVSTPAAIFENSFTVGATRQTDTIANFSSRGTVTVDSSNRLKPNIAAPGVGVRSSIRNGGFATFSGTSMAGPHVAGAVALLISANPELAGQVEAIEELLESTARPMRSDQDCGGVSGMEVPNAVYGYGRMDILAAVQETVSTSSQATIPMAQALHAAPNPARETVLLTSVMPPAAPATVQWFDAQGRLIKTVNWPAMTTQLEVDIRDLPKGVYIVQARMGRALFSTRVVRQ